MESLSDDEFKQMINYMNRYVSTDMDQWELWKFKSNHGSGAEMYITIEMGPSSDSPESAYTDLSHLINPK